MTALAYQTLCVYPRPDPNSLETALKRLPTPFLPDPFSPLVKELPVIQCSHCNEYVLADDTMAEVERILESVDKSTELEIVRYAA